MLPQGFSPTEADEIRAEFVCAICHADLIEVRLEGQYERMLICPEHGNVEDCGRVTRNTVSIEMERAKIQYAVVIRNLPEFWGELIETHPNPIVDKLFAEIDKARYEQKRKKHA